MLDLNVTHCFAIPGSPITHVAEQAAEVIPGFEWSLNEKVAIECAVGLSVIGIRSAVMFKQNGLNVAFDSLLNATVHSIGAGLLIVVADDVDASRSTALQDSRDLAEILRMPLVEAAMDGDVSECITAALRISEAKSVPTVLRLSGPVPKGGAGSHLDGKLAAAASSAPVVNRHIAQGLTKLGRVQHRRLTADTRPEPLLGLAARVRCRPEHDTGIIAFGGAARAVDGLPACHLTVRSDEQASAQVRDFLAQHARVLVAEEPLPHLERRLRMDCRYSHRLVGRLSGHLPPEGALRTTDVAAALAEGPRRWTTVLAKPDKDSTYPPYHELFEAVADHRRNGTFVAVDVGSSVNLCYPPYEASDVAISLGSAISVAGGAARAGKATIAVIGDYALMHSGLQSLLDMSLRRTPVLVVVLVNGVQDKTGRQPLAPGLTQRSDVNATLRRIVEGLSPGVHVASWVTTDGGRERHRRRITELLGLAPSIALVADSAQERL